MEGFYILEGNNCVVSKGVVVMLICNVNSKIHQVVWNLFYLNIGITLSFGASNWDINWIIIRYTYLRYFNSKIGYTKLVFGRVQFWIVIFGQKLRYKYLQRFELGILCQKLRYRYLQKSCVGYLCQKLRYKYL